MVQLLALVFIWLLLFLFGSLFWTYGINEWLIFFDKNQRLVWWQGGLLGFTPYIGKYSLPFAIITWILMLFLV